MFYTKNNPLPYSVQAISKIKKKRGITMTQATQAICQLKKAGNLVNRAFHKNGPKSYKDGQGALLKVLHQAEGETASREELIERLGFDRRELKNVARKAERNGFITFEEAEDSYAMKLTAKGAELAEKRCAAQTKVAEDILSCLSEEEIAQLNAITEKIIVSCKDAGAHGKQKGGKKHHCHKHCKRH